MKKFLLSTTMVAMLASFQPVYASESAEHKAPEHMQAQVEKAPLSTEQALKVLEDGIATMESSISDANRENFFSNGTVMNAWHEKLMDIQNATDALTHHAETLAADKQARLKGAITQFSKTLDDFHEATHERDVSKSAAQIRKSKSALSLLKAYLKE